MPRQPARDRSIRGMTVSGPAPRLPTTRPGDAFRRACTSSQFAVIRFSVRCRRFRTRERRCRRSGVCTEVRFDVPGRRIKSKKFAVIRFKVLGRRFKTRCRRFRDAGARFTSADSRFMSNGVCALRVVVSTAVAVTMSGEGTKAERRRQGRQQLLRKRRGCGRRTTGTSQQFPPDRDAITENLRLACHRERRTLAAWSSNGLVAMIVWPKR